MSIHVTLSSPVTVNLTSLLQDVPRQVQAMTAAGVVSTIAGRAGEVWTVRAFADVFVEFGRTPAPTGSGTLRHSMPSGDVRQWVCTEDGQLVAFATV